METFEPARPLASPSGAPAIGEIVRRIEAVEKSLRVRFWWAIGGWCTAILLLVLLILLSFGLWGISIEAHNASKMNSETLLDLIDLVRAL